MRVDSTVSRITEGGEREMSLAIAMAVASFFAAFSFPYSRLRWWGGWTPLWFCFWYSMYLVISGVGGGFVGWGSAVLLKSGGPTQNSSINGVLYGAMGLVAIHATLGTSTGRGSKDSKGMAATRSLLGGVLRFIERALDDITHNRIEDWVENLSPDLQDTTKLRNVAETVKRRIETRNDVTAATKGLISASYTKATTLIDSTTEKGQRDGTNELIKFCIISMRNTRMRKFVARHSK